MISLNALDRGTGVRRWFLNRAGGLLAAAAIASETVMALFTRIRFSEGRVDGGRVVMRHGVPLAEISGNPAALGTSAGTLFRRQLGPLLRLMGMHPPLIVSILTGRMVPLAGSIPAHYRAELAAMAAAAGVSEDTLVKANLVVDTCCSALVRAGDHTSGRPLVVARNMDFYPAAILGPASVVAVVRPLGRHAFASITWPGYAGVISGLNAPGVCACILLNYGSHGIRPGTPIGFRAREVLENADDLESAARCFAASPVASSHYLLLADDHGAAVVWEDQAGFHRHDLHEGWLACSNGVRDATTPLAIDDRGRCLRGLSASAPEALDRNEPWMRRTMTASYLRGINTQAMLFIPAQRRLQLAVGTGSRAAALSPWLEVDLAQVLAGSPLAEAPVRMWDPVAQPAHHYTD
ncbi:MAG: hypothetical protein H0W83_08595 [Planctomycetes bacterium]|nr:hypothetical protein [Planctomycetota bacterium]